ncbi:hypothetical protein Tco_1407528 [Tanacetum coccineum]
MGTFCQRNAGFAPRSKDNKNWNKEALQRQLRFEDASEKECVLIEILSINDKSCSKSCLQNYKVLKKQYDDLILKLDDTGFLKQLTYKEYVNFRRQQVVKYKENLKVLFSVRIALLKRSVGHKEYLMGLLKTELEKVKEEKEGFEFKLAKFEKSSKDLDDLLASQVTDKSKKGFGYNAVPSPHPLILNRPTPLDLSYTESDNSKENTDDSLTQQPKNVTETSSVMSPLKVDKDWKEKFFHPANHIRVEEPKKARENTDAPIIEDWVSDDEEEVEPIPKVEKKTAIPTATKKKSVKPEKPIRRSSSPMSVIGMGPKGYYKEFLESITSSSTSQVGIVCQIWKDASYFMILLLKSVDGCTQMTMIKVGNYDDCSVFRSNARGTSIVQTTKNVWVLVELPKGHRAIGTKWVYTEENKKDGTGELSMIGSLAMYLTDILGPDIMFGVFWYSKDSPLELIAYTDSDYAGATLDRKSTTGGCQFLGNRLISWQCKKQTVVATSTTEAEYVAAASCCGQVIENGNSWVPILVTTPESGSSTALKMTVPSTAEEKICKKNDVKARSLLLMALPNEHQLTFNQYVDSQSMFAAIKARFGGNEATKRTQKALLKQQYENFNASSSESLDSIFNRLQKLVSRLAILGVVTPTEDLNVKFISDLPFHAVYSHGSDEGSLKLTELTDLVTKLSDRIGVLEADLMKTKKIYSSAYTKLILRVKKLEKTPTEVIQDQEGSEKASDEVSTVGAKKGTTEEVPIVSTAEVWDFNQNIEPMDAEHGSGKQKSPEKSSEKSPEKMKSADKMEEDDVAKETGAKRKKSIP